MKNPIEEYLEVKEAANVGEAFGSRAPGMGQKLMNGLRGSAGSAATMAAVSAGAVGIASGAQRIYDAITKKHDFEMMLENNPALVAHLQEKPKLFNQAYSSLRLANPAFAKDPLIAGSYMSKIMESPEHAGFAIQEAMQGGQHTKHPFIEAIGKGALEGAKSGLSGKR